MARPVLLVEGEGDKSAVPELVRRVCQRLEIYDVHPAPKPILCRGIPHLRKAGEIERFAEYACRRHDGDSVLLILDCEDDCPFEAAVELGRRVQPIAERHQHKFGIAFLEREFETLFLHSLESLAAGYPRHEWTLEAFDFEQEVKHRGAKERLRARMTQGSYKETRDQVRFVSALDLERLAQTCRPYQHLETTLRWLRNEGGSVVHPLPMPGSQA